MLDKRARPLTTRHWLRKCPSATLDIEPPEALWPAAKGQAASMARVRGHPLQRAGGHGQLGIGAYAPIPGDDQHQDHEHLDNFLHPGARHPGPRYLWARRPCFSTTLRPTRTRQDLPCTSAGNPALRIRAISGPLTPVHCGQTRVSRSNQLPSSADLTARCNTPSKLVILTSAVAHPGLPPRAPRLWARRPCFSTTLRPTRTRQDLPCTSAGEPRTPRLSAQGVPAACPIGRSAAGTHGHFRAARHTGSRA